MLKQCSKCANSKPLEEFHRNVKCKGGYNTICKLCANKYNLMLHHRRKDNQSYRQRRRNTWLKFRYGITIDEFDRRLAEQGGVCAVCGGKGEHGRNKQLVCDHDHTSGKVRGILCERCNIGIGHFRDDPALLQRTIDYLKR